MSELRKQLETARSHYLAARYPGDLAADVLGRGSRGWIGPLAAAVAIAAVLAVALLVMTSSTTWTLPPIVQNPGGTTIQPNVTTSNESTTDIDYALGMVPEVTFSDLVNSVELVPPSYDMTFSVPSMFFTVEQSDNATQESA